MGVDSKKLEYGFPPPLGLGFGGHSYSNFLAATMWALGQGVQIPRAVDAPKVCHCLVLLSCLGYTPSMGSDE